MAKTWEEVREFLALLGAGAFGGLLSWIWSFNFGVELHLHPALAAAASIVLGAGAAAIGIFLAKTDTRDMKHALGFAILCGFSWQIVYDAGVSTVERHDARRTIKDAASQVEAAQGRLAEQSPAEAAQGIAQVGGSAAAALAATGTAKSERADEKAVETSLAALDTIQRSSDAAPPGATTAAVEQIAAAALESGHSEVARRAIETLGAVPATPDSRLALERLSRIAEQKHLTGVIDATAFEVAPAAVGERAGGPP